MKKEKVTTNAAQTQEYAMVFAKKLQPGDSVLLYGDLGSGKTTFVQGMAKALGIKSKIISPTFIIVRSYQRTGRHKDSAIKSFYHIDLYRTQDERELKHVGMKDILEDTSAVAAIEWPEKLGTLLPEKRWEVRIRDLTEDKREIGIHYKE